MAAGRPSSRQAGSWAHSPLSSLPGRDTCLPVGGPPLAAPPPSSSPWLQHNRTQGGQEREAGMAGPCRVPTGWRHRSPSPPPAGLGVTAQSWPGSCTPAGFARMVWLSPLLNSPQPAPRECPDGWRAVLFRPLQAPIRQKLAPGASSGHCPRHTHIHTPQLLGPSRPVQTCQTLNHGRDP